MKLQIGQTVYYIVEAFEPEYHFRIAKCKIKSIPTGKLKEYCILENGNMYWPQRKYIYDSYFIATQQAEKEADIYDEKWEKLYHKKILRPWRKENKKRNMQ